MLRTALHRLRERSSINDPTIFDRASRRLVAYFLAARAPIIVHYSAFTRFRCIISIHSPTTAKISKDRLVRGQLSRVANVTDARFEGRNHVESR